jgi:hypothetical protein
MNLIKFNKVSPILISPLINLLINSIFYSLNITEFYFSYWQVLTCYGLIYVNIYASKELDSRKIIYITVLFSIIWPVIELIRTII